MAACVFARACAVQDDVTEVVVPGLELLRASLNDLAGDCEGVVV